MEMNSVLSNLCGGQRVPWGGLRDIGVGSVTSPCSTDWLRGAFSVTLWRLWRRRNTWQSAWSHMLAAVMLAGGVPEEVNVRSLCAAAFSSGGRRL